jgi:hypothetical protein
MQVPFIVPRRAFSVLRAYVEKVHGRPFDDVLAGIYHSHQNAMPVRQFSQQTVLGCFLMHFGNDIPDLLLGTGLTGIRYVWWGREEVGQET